MTKKTMVILGSGLALVTAAAVAGTRVARPRSGAGHAGQGRLQADLAFGSLSAALTDPKLLLGHKGETYVTLTLDVRNLPEGTVRPPLRMALVIDRSGSMAGEKLGQAQRAAQGIVNKLRDDDQVALVQYDDQAQLVVPLASLDSAARTRMTTAIQSLSPGGSTNLHGGLELGRDQVAVGLAGAGVNRVLLLSDGQANVGVVAPGAIGQTASQAADRGIRISTIGVGLDYNEDLMEAIAENGRGQYYFVDNAANLERVFAAELGALQGTVARQVEVRIEPATEGVEVLSALGYQAYKQQDTLVVPMADLFGGDKRQLVVKLRLPADRLGPAEAVRVRLAYQDLARKQPAETTLALHYEVSSDAAAVLGAADRQAHTSALQAETAAAMRSAAVEYEQGNNAMAQRVLARQQANIQAAARQFALPQAAVAAPMNSLGSTASQMAQFDFGSMDGKRLLKSSKSSARAFSKSSKVFENAQF